MNTSPSSSSSIVTKNSAINTGSTKSDNTTSSSLASSPPKRASEEQYSSSSSSSRGRSNRKDALNQQHVCVIAFLVREDNTEDGSKAIGKIQEIRRQFDQAHRRWLPHITLIPPFMVPFASVSASNESNGDGDLAGETSSSQEIGPALTNTVRKDLDEISNKIEQVCRNYVQHTIHLGEIGHFPLRRYRTVHLRPLHTSTELFTQLQKSLEDALPEAAESSRGNKKNKKSVKELYKPHLTLGQSYSQDMHNRINKLATLLISKDTQSIPIKVTVDKIQLMNKPTDQSGPYDIYREFHLHDVNSI